MIFLTSSCGARIAVPATSVVDAARLLESVLNSDFAVTANGEQIEVGKFSGLRLLQIWTFKVAATVEFVSPISWQKGLEFALSERWALVG